MWVTCAQPALLKAVQLVGRAISTRTTMPILGYILLETKKDGVKLTATDLELAIQTEVEAEIKQGGQMTLPARIFTEIVGNLGPATVEIKGQEGAAPAEITCETSHFEILGLPAGDFPTLPRTNGEPVASIEADVARMMVNQTLFDGDLCGNGRGRSTIRRHRWWTFGAPKGHAAPSRAAEGWRYRSCESDGRAGAGACGRIGPRSTRDGG